MNLVASRIGFIHVSDNGRARYIFIKICILFLFFVEFVAYHDALLLRPTLPLVRLGLDFEGPSTSRLPLLFFAFRTGAAEN